MKQKEIADVLTDTPTEIGTVRLSYGGWIGRKLGLKRKTMLTVAGQPNGKVELIGAELFAMLGEDALKKLNQTDQINLLLKSNVTPIVNIIALAVCRGDKMPSRELVDAIRFSFTMEQLETAFYEVYRRLDLKAFFGIMGFAKSLQLNLFQDQEAPSQES
ncbi:hypothetical protein [Sphingobacterium hotanense]|uniref:Uncharacterized protein n=1 Tax=Sphingobacterium hotanense TaxID=649196 RepID=A0ABT7NQ43_9SPHI|nr:hypothetical protein [Sphingobacterium hotanense]MDM1049379.1 hypothetical protein [Sphingobacterium hotanense]